MQKNTTMAGMQSVALERFTKRDELINSIQVATYTSLGVRRSFDVHESKEHRTEEVDSIREQASDIKRFRSLVKPETSRIDVCSTIMVGHEFFFDVLERLFIKLYGSETFFSDVYRRRPDVCRELLDNLGDKLKHLLGWDGSFSKIHETMRPDSLWLFSISLDDPELDGLYQKMIRFYDCLDGENRNLLKYLSINRWHPRSVRHGKINLSFADKVMLESIFGEEVAALIIYKKEQIFRQYVVDNLEKESFSGMFVMLKPSKFREIVVQSCYESGFDFSVIEPFVEFGRYFPARREWLIDNNYGCRLICRPSYL